MFIKTHNTNQSFQENKYLYLNCMKFYFNLFILKYLIKRKKQKASFIACVRLIRYYKHHLKCDNYHKNETNKYGNKVKDVLRYLNYKLNATFMQPSLLNLLVSTFYFSHFCLVRLILFDKSN